MVEVPIHLCCFAADLCVGGPCDAYHVAVVVAILMLLKQASGEHCFYEQYPQLEKTMASRGKSVTQITGHAF